MTKRSPATLFDYLHDCSKEAALETPSQAAPEAPANGACPPTESGGRPWPGGGLPRELLDRAACRTERGALIIDDCLNVLSKIPDETFDLVITSPPYDGQPKYGNGERYERDWYRGF